MNKNKLTNFLLILVIVLLIGTVTISLVVTWNSGSSEEIDLFKNYEADFGILKSPIDYNINSSIMLNFDADPNLQISNKVFKINQEDQYFSSEELADKVAQNLDFTEKSSTENSLTFSSTSTSEYLNYNSKLDKIYISFNSKTTNSTKDTLKKESAALKAQSQLELIELWPFENKKEGKDYRTSYRYYTAVGNNYYETSQDQKADLIETVYTSLVEDKYPVITDRSNSGEIEVLVNSSNDIIKISYRYLPERESTTYPVINFEEAVNEIKEKRAEVVTVFETDIPSSLNVTYIDFSYKPSSENAGYLQPVFIFEGVDNNDNYTSLIVPAVDQEYLL